jgi:hypothetical protein
MALLPAPTRSVGKGGHWQPLSQRSAMRWFGLLLFGTAPTALLVFMFRPVLILGRHNDEATLGSMDCSCGCQIVAYRGSAVVKVS